MASAIAISFGGIMLCKAWRLNIFGTMALFVLLFVIACRSLGIITLDDWVNLRILVSPNELKNQRKKAST
jgi:isoprenylcysteine carboxyl methyltransferase (ICMT) family protein YpbQ